MRSVFQEDPLVAAYLEWLPTLGIDSVAEFTFPDDPRAQVSTSANRVKWIVRNFFSDLTFKGNYIAVTENHVDRTQPHVHILFESGSVSHDEMERKWRARFGMVASRGVV